MQHGFSQKLLNKPLNLKDIKFSEGKKEEKKTGSKLGQSKFYSVPESILGPKKKQPRKYKSHGTTAMNQASEKKLIDSRTDRLR